MKITLHPWAGLFVWGLCTGHKKEKNCVDFSLAETQSIEWRPGVLLHKHTHLCTSHANVSAVQGPVGSWLSFPISHYVPYRMLYPWRAFQLLTLGAWTCNSVSLSLFVVLLCSSLSSSLLRPRASSAFFPQQHSCSLSFILKLFIFSQNAYFPTSFASPCSLRPWLGYI